MSIETSAGRSFGAPSPGIRRFTVSSSMRRYMSKPDRVHEARLLGAEQIAGAAQLEILERDAIARAELGVVLEHLQAALGVGDRRRRARGDSSTRGGASGPTRPRS